MQIVKFMKNTKYKLYKYVIINRAVKASGWDTHHHNEGEQEEFFSLTFPIMFAAPTPPWVVREPGCGPWHAV